MQTSRSYRSKGAMMRKLTLGEIDLVDGVLPITRAAAGLAEVIRRAKESKSHIAITQNGYITAVIMDIQSYNTMRKLAEERLEQIATNGDRTTAGPSEGTPADPVTKTD